MKTNSYEAGAPFAGGSSGCTFRATRTNLQNPLKPCFTLISLGNQRSPQ